jgi:hypothetical protein
MNPYRTLPRLGPEIDPELDRLAVPFRVLGVRAGWIVVTPSVLRFEPRFGRPREVRFDEGLAALALSFAYDVEHGEPNIVEQIAAWRQLTASAPYQEPLAHARRGVVEIAHAHSMARGVDATRPFAVVVDADRLFAIEAVPAAHLCFRLTEDQAPPTYAGLLLSRALAWLGPEAFAETIGRIREQSWRSVCRVFTREHVRDRPAYTVEDRRFELLGESSRDAIALEPTLAESVMLARWAAGEHVR